MIYTGYFAKLKVYEEANLVPVSITRYRPKWFKGEECKLFAPSADLLDRYKADCISKEDFTARYIAQLDEMASGKIAENVARKRDIVLCCYEAPGDFCHRHILANYLNEKFNMNITEYPV